LALAKYVAAYEEFQIVRKQFHPHMKKEAYKKELRNLSILSSVQHENIIPLLSAYTHGTSFNLIFPLVSHGNLDQLFRSDTSSSLAIMESEKSVVMAISGLASALATLHEFILEHLLLIGCHRDLKPTNILVDDGRLLLADFGLSRIVEGQDSSSSMAPNIPEDFIAPEHEDKDFFRNPIGRSSDIWAFGCVMLMLLVFYQGGCKGLEQLKTKRRREGLHYTHYCFHDYDKPNSGLEESFDTLALNPSPFVQGLLSLIKKMLILDKNMRPKAAAVDSNLRSLAIYMWSTSIEEEFGKACEREDSQIHVFVERVRFQGWRSAAKMTDSDFPAFPESFAGASYGDFKIIIDHLQEVWRLLADFGVQGRKAFFPLRSRIDRLLEVLDVERRTSAVAYTDYVLLESKEPIWLLKLQDFFAEALDKRAESKVFTRRRVLDPSTVPRASSGNLCVDFSTFETLPQIGMASKVRIRSKSGSDTVIAEENLAIRRYAPDTTPGLYLPWMPARLQETADLLTMSANERLFRVLRCRGYYHNPLKLRSGLLYELPDGPNGKFQEMVTLRELLQSDNSQWLLGDRFRLAHGLALALFELHSVSWLHRNMSASNVVFFPHEDGRKIDPQSFYFIGFAQSRADRDLTESDGPTHGFHNEDYYVHPEYLYQNQGFQAPHDYYALGILLLEIGFWQIYPNIPREGLSRRATNDVRTIALEELVPQLGALMGKCYRDSVLACLDGTLSVEASAADDKLPLRFWESVADHLGPSNCRA